MNRDFNDNIQPDNKVISAEIRQVPKHLTHVASINPHPGHRVYEFNLATGEIQEAKVEEVQATYGGGMKKKIIQREGYMYASALNAKNSIKKFAQLYAQLVAGGHIVRPNQNPDVL